MKFVQGIILIVFALSAETKTHSFPYHHLKDKTHFVQDEDFYVNPGQVFGMCYEMTLYEKRIKVKCTFIMETKEDSQSPKHLRTCNFTLDSVTSRDKANYYIPLKVSAIDEDKAFLIMKYIDCRRFYILHFADCRAVELLKIDLPNQIMVTPTHHTDRFEIIAMKDEDGSCKSKYCRWMVDTEGNVLENKHDWLHEDSEIVAIALKGRVVVDKSQKGWKKSDDGLARIYSVNPDGTINITKMYQAQAGPGIHYGAVTASTTNDLLTVCSTNNNSLTYAQFNSDGNLKFNGTWFNDKINLLRTLRVHNLPRGGFLLVMTLCTREYEVKNCEKSRDNIYLKRFDEHGDEAGSLPIPNHERLNAKTLHFYVDRDGQFCFSDVNGHDTTYDGTIHLHVNCYEDREFTTLLL